MTMKHIQSENGQDNVTRATALGYDAEKDEAPRILAKGMGATAERIIELAKEHDIPIMEDPVLVSALSMLEVDQLIPPELYAVVAEILVYVYRIQQKRMP